MDIEIWKTLIQNWVFFALFCALLYWFLVKYLPKREEEYKLSIANMQKTFSDSLDKVVRAYENSTESITKRLDSIETDIRNLKK